MSAFRIPFNRPYLVGTERDYIEQALQSRHLHGDGPFTHRCHKLLEQHCQTQRVLLTNSCTAALEMAALLLDVQPGDEVLIPSFTFVSTANPFVLRGAVPRFIDSRPDTLNLDESLLEAHINERTKGIVPMHYAGVGCDMTSIMALAEKHKLWVVEDAAQALDATFAGKALGTFGEVGALSFHDTKNIIAGEGGALQLNRDSLLERAEIVREKGTNRSQFFRGQVDKYTWVDVGSSFLPSELQAAILLAQLEAMSDITRTRKAIFARYEERLQPLAQRGLLTLPTVPAECQDNAHMFYLLLPDLSTRTALVDALKEKGIQTVFHYVPLHLSAMGERMGYTKGMMPVAERANDCLLRLPMFNELTHQEVDEITLAIAQFFGVEI